MSFSIEELKNLFVLLTANRFNLMAQESVVLLQLVEKIKLAITELEKPKTEEKEKK